MNQDRKSLAFGGTCGGFVAIILGLAVARQYGLGLWTIAPVSLLGGAFGWLACDFAGAKSSVKTAWKQVIGWKPDKEWWKEHLLPSFAVSMFACSVTFWFLLIAPFIPLEFTIYAALGMAVFFFLVVLMVTSGGYFTRDELKTAKILLTQWNVVALPFSIIRYSWKGLVWTLPRTLPAGKTAGKFMWRVFVLAHSYKRQICFLGTTLGTAIGYYQGYVRDGNLVLWALLGGILGGALSVAWREIVAVRWLGIKPS